MKPDQVCPNDGTKADKPDVSPASAATSDPTLQELVKEVDERLARILALYEDMKKRIQRERQAEERQWQELQESERRRVASEKAARERKKWDDAWNRYTAQRATLKEFKAQRSHETVPWPVKSGHWSDVTEANVKEFLRKAPPFIETPRAAFQRMQTESLRWHPDKISVLFGSTAPDQDDRKLVSMVSQVVIVLRAEAQTRMNKQSCRC